MNDRGIEGRFPEPETMVRNEFSDLRLATLAPSYQRWVLDAFGAALGGEIIEVGPGPGNFTRFLARRGRRVTAVEPEGIMADAIEALGLPNVEVIRSTVENLPTAAGPYDCAVALNVLEHIRDDAEALVATAARLRPGGAICILVPAHQMLFGSLDERYGHFRRYGLRDVAALIQRARLDLGVCRYFNPLGAIGWFAVARVFRARQVGRLSVSLTDRVGVPVGRALERFGAPPFGQSVLAVGRRV